MRHHPIGAFLAWCFTVGWAPACPPVVARHALQLDLPVPPFLVASTFLGLLPPVVVITLVGGRAGGCPGAGAAGRPAAPSKEALRRSGRFPEYQAGQAPPSTSDTTTAWTDARLVIADGATAPA